MSNKRWAQEDEKHVLYWEPFHDEGRLAEIFIDGEGDWCLNCELLHADGDYLGSESLEDAMRDAEGRLQEHFETERDYYDYLLKSFGGE